MICGRGQMPRLGGCAGFTPALLALGYEWDHNTTLGFAHIGCIRKAQKKAEPKELVTVSRLLWPKT